MSGFVNQAPVDLHKARHDHPFGLLPAFREALVYEQNIQSEFTLFCFDGRDLSPPSKSRFDPGRIFFLRRELGRVR